jgi:hypothetical protein
VILNLLEPMYNELKNMTLWNVVITVGVATIAGALIYIGRKLQVLDDLVTTTNKLKNNVKVVCDFLTTNNTNFSPTEVQAYSPLRLTPEGEELVKTLGFNNVFKNNKQDFFNYIDEEDPKLKYDVELAAIKSVYLLSNKEYMSFLKVFFYNNPTRNMENTAPTLGVYIREAYLAKHPEITQ